MKASFVIATYNRKGDLERCLDTVLNQQDCELEVIVVDDGSTDGTSELVLDKYGKSVRLIRREQNCGSIRNRNLGAREATGDVLFLIDDDVELPGPFTVNEVLRQFEDPRIGAIAIPYYQHGKFRHSSSGRRADGETIVFASYVGCASAVRRVVFLDLGGYEEFFFHNVEEDDFCLRMMQSGLFVAMGCVTEPMIHYESSLRDIFSWDYYGRRNTLLYAYKNCPVLYLLPNLLYTTLNGLIHGIRIKRLKGNLSGLVAGWRAILCSIGGRGLTRAPVSRKTYVLSRRLRKKSYSLDYCIRYLGRMGC